MSSLNKALFAFFNTHVSEFTFSSAITLSFLLLLLSFLPGESDHVSYMTDKFSCSIYKLKAALGHLCVMLIVQGLHPMFDLYPDSIIVISVIYCVSLLLPSSQSLLSSVGGSVAFLITTWFHFQYFLMVKTQSFDDRTSGFIFIIGEFLCFSCQLLLID